MIKFNEQLQAPLKSLKKHTAAADSQQRKDIKKYQINIKIEKSSVDGLNSKIEVKEESVN